MGTPSGTAGSASATASDATSTPAKATAAATANGQPSTATKESQETSDKSTGKDKDGADGKPKTTTLNPDAKEFKMSASAREFKPTFTIPSAKPVVPMQGGHGGGMAGGPNMPMVGAQGMMPSSPMQQGQQGMGNVNGQGMPRGGYTPPGQAQGMMQTSNGQMMVNPNNMQPMNMNMMPAQGGYVNGQYQPVQMQYNQYGMPMMVQQMGGPQPVMMSYGQGPPNQANGNTMQPMGGMDIMQVN